jgi:hypothetical protein
MSPIKGIQKNQDDMLVHVDSYVSKDKPWFIHQIGEIEDYWIGDNLDSKFTITYDDINYEFTIKSNDNTVSFKDYDNEYNGPMPFFFKIKSGLQYKVNILTNELLWK